MLRDRIDGGHSFEDIVAEMTAFIARMKTRFVLEDLSNLVKNGRISKVAGLLSGMLSLRPIMGDDGHGSIAAIEKVRGTQNAMRRLVELIAEGTREAAASSLTMVLSYCNCPEPVSYTHLVPAHVEMMGLIGMGNNPMVGATVACAVAASQA